MSTSRPKWRGILLRCASLALLAGPLALPGQARAQQVTVSGTVTDASNNQPLPGVAVRLQGTGTSTVTNGQGRYSLQVPANGVLTFSRTGFQNADVSVARRSQIDVQLSSSPVKLEELVVTGYQTQRRADITSAVSTVNTESLERTQTASVLQKLAGRVPGVTVATSGSPGSRSTVRIRGISSFQNNDPLYIIDGTPVEESYANFLNPQDVESIQVLKDASAASIYGARASNGVIIITTKKGKRGAAPQITADLQYGMTTPVRGYDDFIIYDAAEYGRVWRAEFQGAGLPVPQNIYTYDAAGNPILPKFIWPNNGKTQTNSVDPSTYSYPNNLIIPASTGTNWWNAVFGTGAIRDANLSVRGGSDASRYAVGVNYFDQLGTARGNRYQRGTARVNTDFTAKRFTFGENLTVALEESYGGIGNDGFGEGNILGKNILSQPIVPIYDIQGNFASGKAVNLGNNTNPVKVAEFAVNNRNTNSRIFGNVFGRLNLTDGLTANTSLGLNNGGGTYRGYNPPFPENSEPSFNNSIYEGENNFWNWTWNNTLNLVQTYGANHVNFLVGTEAIKSRGRSINGGLSNVITTNPNGWYIQDALGDPATKTVSSGGGVSTLLSYFGKADYNYNDRYYLSGTLRRDGSSRLGPDNRWGTFPAFSAGWRLSQEGFLRDNEFITNLMLRFGYGVTGNQNIAAGRVFSTFGGSTGSSFYDITGANTAIVTGYRETAIGNPNLKWEENRSTNLGMDMDFFGGAASLVLDVYRRDSNNLLFNPPLPATAGQAAAPIVNIGQVRNTGIDGALSFHGSTGGGLGWNLDLNASHYRNEVLRIDGQQEFFFGPIGSRYNRNITINQVGSPIGSFYGYKVVGIFQSQAEIDALNAAARQKNGANAVYQAAAKPGRFQFADVNGDGVITGADRTIIGSPHPDLTAGMALGLNWRSFDFAADLFGTFGNQIYDTQKEFYVFHNFNTTVRKDLLANSARVENGVVVNPNAKYPRLDYSDQASSVGSSFYVEDGSYVRLRSLQLGYRVPNRRFGLENVRVYVRGENLFTLTGYDGLDPSLPALNANSSAGDIRDQALGIDRGVYPSNRVLSLGLSVGF